ncbi:MAG TPA: hypothetical protein VIZ90_05300 [Rhizobiaceae bacterium]
MKFGTVANPQQVAAMANVVDAYCRLAGIEPEAPEREQIAVKIVELFATGVRSQNDLLAALILPPCSGGGEGHRSAQPDKQGNHPARAA